MSRSIILVAQYDEKDYRLQKEKINRQNFFATKSSYKDPDGDDYLLPANEFSINSFTFRVLEASDYSGFEYPKSIGMIAMSDEKSTIAYMCFQNSDLDCISFGDDRDPKGSMIKFVSENFKYNKW
ncbi:hypothetical protein SDC9_116479 [bioreactor metagenome]|uniref:Uncharacterized protein n=1 Tax=bioreactor metagenome TaxID=1076179 RepID=A0A645C6G1_9ZZZZ